MAFGLTALVFAYPSRSSAQEALPLVEVPAAGPDSTVLALMISGDGNWASADKKIAAVLAADGIAVVGLKARDYLTHHHPTPDDAARDVEGVLRTYLARWHRDRILLVGYSRGADMMPFVANRLPADLRTRVRGMVLIGPVENASFEFHLIDLVKNEHRDSDVPLLPEVERLDGIPILCIYGEDEHDTFCRTAPQGLVALDQHDGGHQIHDPDNVARSILDWLDRADR